MPISNKRFNFHVFLENLRNVQLYREVIEKKVLYFNNKFLRIFRILLHILFLFFEKFKWLYLEKQALFENFTRVFNFDPKIFIKNNRFLNGFKPSHRCIVGNAKEM